MSRHDDIVTRWIDRELGRTTRPNLSARADNVIAWEGRIDSYGSHFTLAEPIRDNRGTVTGWLLNGDRYSVSTTRHQNTVRNACERTGLPTLIIPFSALDSAGIVRSTVRPVEITTDGWETIRHPSPTLPDGATWHKRERWEYVDLSADELAAKVDERNASEAVETERRNGYIRDAAEGSYWHGRDFEPPRVITADDLGDWQRREHRCTGHYYTLGMGRRGWPTVAVDGVTSHDTIPTGGTYTWETSRHWLGESVVRAAVRTGRGPRERRWSYFLSGFDLQESRRLYFFAELPRGPKPTTVAEAYEVLKPDTVKAAEIMGRDVTRQGDIFGVSMTTTKRELRAQGATFERYSDRVTFVDVTSRDGNVYSVPRVIPGHAALLGQNHYATEVARVGGETFARGCLYHAPEHRDPDHARRKLGDGKAWHLIVKNTVPTGKGR